ncbi:hypothetical protein LTR41_002968 [Exophiala xenobiotica]|nr:hypothetical protein LTR41_002968 [Exophiala xenobiotica]
MNNNKRQLGSPVTSPTLSTTLFPSAAAPPPDPSAGRPGPSSAGSIEQAFPVRESTPNFDLADWLERDVASSPSETMQQPTTTTPQDQIIPSQDTVPPAAPGKAVKAGINTQSSPDSPSPRADLANGTEVFLLDGQGNSVACSETVQPLDLHELPVNRAEPSSLGNVDNPARFNAPCIFRVDGRSPPTAYKLIPKNGHGPERVGARPEVLVPVRFRPGDYVYYLDGGERWEAVVETVEVLKDLRRYGIFITRQGQSQALVTDDRLEIYSGQGIDG